MKINFPRYPRYFGFTATQAIIMFNHLQLPRVSVAEGGEHSCGGKSILALNVHGEEGVLVLPPIAHERGDHSHRQGQSRVMLTGNLLLVLQGIQSFSTRAHRT